MVKMDRQHDPGQVVDMVLKKRWEFFQPENIILNLKNGDGSIMMWGVLLLEKLEQPCRPDSFTGSVWRNGTNIMHTVETPNIWPTSVSLRTIKLNTKNLDENLWLRRIKQKLFLSFYSVIQLTRYRIAVGYTTPAHTHVCKAPELTTTGLLFWVEVRRGGGSHWSARWIALGQS